MKYFITFGILLSLLTASAQAAIDGFAVTLNAGAPTYTVPAGKVLILQQVSLPSGASGAAATISIRDAATSSTTAVPVPGANTNLYKFSPSLYLPAGTLVAGPTGSGAVGLYGLLVDTADMYLFVNVRSTINNLHFANNLLTGEVQVASTLPVTVNFQSSTNLVDWNFDTAVVIRPGVGKSKYNFTAVASGKGRFYRAVVRRRIG